MNSNRAGGIKGEVIARHYLEAKGYRFVTKNFSAVCGEIDLIFLDDKTIVFVEVKSRMTCKYGLPVDAVTRAKQRKICRTAAIFLKQEDAVNAQFRFDVVEVLDGIVNHISSAFEGSLFM